MHLKRLIRIVRLLLPLFNNRNILKKPILNLGNLYECRTIRSKRLVERGLAIFYKTTARIGGQKGRAAKLHKVLPITSWRKIALSRNSRTLHNLFDICQGKWGIG